MSRCLLYRRNELACLNCPYEHCVEEEKTRTSRVQIEQKKKRLKNQIAVGDVDALEELRAMRVLAISRKSMRKKRIREGNARRYGTALIQNQEVVIYKGLYDYYFFTDDNKYGELTEEEMECLSVKVGG